MTLDEMDALIGLGKPASKTADWIVNTYLPNAPVSYRLSIENAVATAIVEATRSPVESAPALAPFEKPKKEPETFEPSNEGSFLDLGGYF